MLFAGDTEDKRQSSLPVIPESYCGFTFASRITFAHFAVSSA